MTFQQFVTVVKKERPDIYKVYPHETRDRHGTKVEVLYTENGKPYHFGGSYVQILRSLGIKAVTRTEINEVESYLANEIARHGTKCFFSDKPLDTSKKQEELRALLNEYTSKYIIIEA